MKKPVLTPREFMVLNLLDGNRHYKVTEIRDLYNHFIILYGRQLFYLDSAESFPKIIWELTSKGYLEKATPDGDFPKLRLSHKGIIEKEPGDQL